MKIKKYVAKTIIDAMKEIRSELGTEAIILSTKEVYQGGFLGMFKSKRIEVIATVDPEPMPEISNQSQMPNTQDIAGQQLVQKNENMKIFNEINELKRMLQQERTAHESQYGYKYTMMLDYLSSQEVEETLAQEIIETVIDYHETNALQPTVELINRDTKREIEKRLIDISFNGRVDDQKVIHFVGPTGVGKTTTLAKVAAKSILLDNKKVAFITTDTYRIAAIEQLKTYARILNIPIEVAYTIDDYKKAIENFSNYDLIYVDTAGRNFRDKQYIEELEAHIGLNSKVNLVLALTAKQRDIIEIYEQFNHLPIKEVIFTKLDETRQYGSILNIALKNKMNIAYLTNGQDVPDDLIEPTPKEITDYLLGGFTND